MNYGRCETENKDNEKQERRNQEDGNDKNRAGTIKFDIRLIFNEEKRRKRFSAADNCPWIAVVLNQRTERG